jgi:potassium-dependent mechanosensitive channel
MFPTSLARITHRARSRSLLTILLVTATCAGAQNPLTQLVTGKPKPAQTTPAPAATPAVPAPAVQPAPEPSPPQVIPLPEVAMRLEELTQTLIDVAANLPADDQLQGLSNAISQYGAAVESKRKEADALLASSPASLELREQETYWRAFQTSSAVWRKQLLGWANAEQRAINQLNQLEPTWAATLDAYHSDHELETLILLIRGNLDNLHKLRSKATQQLQSTVNLQIALGSQEQAAADVMAKLTVAQQALAERLFERDSLPFWQLGARRQQGENRILYTSARTRWLSIGAFLRERTGAVVFLCILLGASLLLAYRVHRAASRRHLEQALPDDASLLIDHWVALGLLAPLLTSYVFAPSAPFSLIGLTVLFSFFPILRLLAPMLRPSYRKALFGLAAYYAALILIGWAPLPAVLKRELGFAIALAVFVSLAYLLRPSRRAEVQHHSVLVLGARVATLALGVSLVANLLGYVRLAQYVGIACLYSSFVAISMYTGTRVYTILLKAALDLPQAERLAIARIHRDGLRRWVPRILTIVAVLVWLSTTLDLLGVRESVVSAITAGLDFHIAGSASETTLGSVLAFFLMLVIGYVIASAVRFLLREELLNRLHMGRGLPDLIASTVYYLLLLFVFLSAVRAGQVELNKFTLLTGALGVGFGFGMQNIINNFVSGLILQYERPIHINDVLEVEGYTGKVTRIGVRSSTLQTPQGAEVIIPNANFISGKVVNWTLSESMRRAELAVGVAYGTDPKAVLKFLLDAANKHESVLTTPQPMAYFIGFGDSALNFELHFWVMQDSNWIRVRSEIAMAVMKSLEDAGIEIPFPQRDLHLRSMPEGMAATELADSLFGKNGNEERQGQPQKKKTVATDGD